MPIVSQTVHSSRTVDVAKTADAIAREASEVFLVPLFYSSHIAVGRFHTCIYSSRITKFCLPGLSLLPQRLNGI